MGAVFGNITVMQFADLLILFGLLVLIIVLAVLIAAHFSGSRQQQKLILSHIDGTITEIRDAVVAGNQEKQQETSPDPEEKQEEKRTLTVVRIDNRIGSSSERPAVRKPAVVRIDGRVEAEAGREDEPEISEAPEQKESTSAQQPEYAAAAEPAGTKKTGAAETPDTSPDNRQAEDTGSEEHPSRNIRYRSRDCGVDKNGKAYSVDQLRDQIR